MVPPVALSLSPSRSERRADDNATSGTCVVDAAVRF